MPSLASVSGRFDSAALMKSTETLSPKKPAVTPVANAINALAVDATFSNHKRLAAALAQPAEANPNAFRKVAIAYSQGS